MNKDIFEENDRNIRVFGLETQKKLFESEVIIMNITPMMTELCKNLVLSGAGICLFNDNSKINENDYQNNFFFNINDKGKKKAEILKSKIKTFKESCRINIIADIDELKNKKFKYGAIDLSDDTLVKGKINELEKIMIENKGILYYIRIENDKAIFLNNILEKKLLDKNEKEHLFVKDENLEMHIALSDDESSDNDNNDNNNNKKEDKLKEEEKNKNKIENIELTNNNENENDDEKKEEILNEDDYAYFDLEKKSTEIKELIPKNAKKYVEYIINDSFRMINYQRDCSKNKKNPLNCLVNYIIGGVVCHEIINCISKKKNPRTNIYCFNALNGKGAFINELYDKVIK